MAEETSEARRQAERFFATWNAEGAAAAADRLWDPDIVREEPAHFPDSGVHRGREACVRRMDERFSLLGAVKIEVVDADRSETRC